MSEATLESVLAEHAGVNSTAAWNGSPNPSNPDNIRRVCRCGEVIGWHDRSKQRDGRWYPLSGSPFDEPHRAHVAAAVLAWIEGRLADGDVRAAVEATFSASEHAPMSDHDPRTGECTSCPWPAREVLTDAELADAALAAVRGVLGEGSSTEGGRK